MKFQGLDGRIYSVQFERKQNKNPSSYHEQARSLLKELYPSDPIVEELYLPGSDRLYLDFFLPLRNLAIEIQGEQHYKYVGHFHGDILGFIRAKKKDKDKEDWCLLNKIKLVKLSYKEVSEWKNRLQQRND